MTDLHKRSGSFTSKNRLTAFLYDLMRDHLTIGVVEALTNANAVDREVKYTNGWLAQYAQDVAGRLAPNIFETARLKKERDDAVRLLERLFNSGDGTGVAHFLSTLESRDGK